MVSRIKIQQWLLATSVLLYHQQPAKGLQITTRNVSNTTQRVKQNHLIITCRRFADLNLGFRLHTCFAVFITDVVANMVFGPQFQGKIFLAFGARPTDQTLDALARCFTFCMEFEQKTQLIPLLTNGFCLDLASSQSIKTNIGSPARQLKAKTHYLK